MIRFPLPLAFALLFLSGCGRTQTLSQVDGERAVQVATDALTAWKGEIWESIIDRPYPIRFVDDSQAEGAALVDFEFGEVRASADGQIVLLSVNLTLKDESGKMRTEKTEYQVSYTPPLTVLRIDR